MKIKLVYPKIKEPFSFDLTNRLLGIKSSAIPLAIPTLAALTPDNFDVTIENENVKAIRYKDDVDLIGITYNTHNAKRAFEICKRFKRYNKTVIMGGIHASMMPDEALRHCDAVVVGEAEKLWLSAINDFERGKLKPIYESSERIGLDRLIVPRWDLIDTRQYLYIPIQISRGCPHNCEFCLDSKYYGRNVRTKPVEHVIEEINFIYENEKTRPIMFADYNFLYDATYLSQITRHMAKLGLQNWIVFGHIGIGNDDEALSLLAEGGCSIINVGIESVSQASLDILGRRTYRADKLEDLINNIRSYGIDVFAGFIFGSDADTPEIFEETVDFINRTNIFLPQINILQPYPGSDLYNRLKKENRLLFGEKWEKYDRNTVCFRPKRMSTEQLQEGYNWTIKKLFSYDSLFDRLNRLLREGFYTREKFVKQIQSHLIKGLSIALPKLLPFFTRDQGLKHFLKLCNLQPVKPNLHAILVAIGYHRGYVNNFGYEFEYNKVNYPNVYLQR